jgi:predicted phage baseplate assembly protein
MRQEILGGSDGVTMFLRFELKGAPLTMVPGADGGEPAIDVFVNDVQWTRVDDFFYSSPHDRHYRLEFSDTHTVSVVFGSGVKGAIPASGKKHIRAVYRQGLGANGNVDRRSASRIKKAHPLVTGATNPAPLRGGADAAGLADLQRQATRFIRTFDRAVSVQDYADLALLFPGVARAAARPQGAGIEVIVATADGAEPPLGEVQAFLDARRDTTQALYVLGPDPVDLWLDLVVEHDSALLTENVKRGVQQALVGEDGRGPGLFTFAAREFGQAAHLSEVYERVGGPNGVEGVTFVDVTRFRIGDVGGVFDVLQASARQWLRLQPANLTIHISPGAAE